jgi:predicted nuclease of predicted toxin-antitoxin system
MEFRLDQGVPRWTVAHLQQVGLPAVHVGQLGLASATDEAILDAARDRNTIVVTLDADFHALLACTNAFSPSVIRIRIQGLKGDGVARVIQQVARAVEHDLLAGAAVTVTDRRLALRRLPLIPKSGPGQSEDGGLS